MSRRPPVVPSVPAVRVTDPAAQRVLEALKSLAETREGHHDPRDRGLTLRDMEDLGLVEIRISRDQNGQQASVFPTVTGGEDSDYASIPPPEVVSFSATGLFATIMLEWGTPTYANHAYVEIWRASALYGEDAPNHGDYQWIGNPANAPEIDSPPASNEARVFYYRARNVSTSGLKSGWTDVVSAQLAVDPGYIMSVLLNKAGSPWVTGDPLLIEVPADTEVGGVAVPAGVYMHAAFIENGTITNAKIANLAVDNAKIASLSADKIKTGTLQATEKIVVDGAIAGGKVSYGDITGGFWIGKDSGSYKFSIGSDTSYLMWDGATLSLTGGANVGGDLSAVTITASDIVGGSIRYGKATWDSTDPGYWLGTLSPVGPAVFHIGDTSSYLMWNGATSTLEVKGLIDTSVFHASVITDSAIASTNTLLAPTYILDPLRVPGLGGGMMVAANVPGLDLTNPFAVPTKLCFPSILIDDSMPSLISGAYDAVPVGEEVTARAGGEEKYLRAGAFITYGSGGPVVPGGTLATYFTPPAASVFTVPATEISNPVEIFGAGFTNSRLRTPTTGPDFDSGDPSNPAALSRCANGSATLRVRITDRALFSSVTGTATGTEFPPHWHGAMTTGYITRNYGGVTTPGVPTGVPGGVDTNGAANACAWGGRLFQVVVYPGFLSGEPDNGGEANAQAVLSRAAYVGVPAGSISPPAYLLDLSVAVHAAEMTFATAKWRVPKDDPVNGGYYVADEIPLHGCMLWRDVIGGVLTDTAQWSQSFAQDGWTITAEYTGPGGTIEVVAERTVSYDHASLEGGYTALARIGSCALATQISWNGSNYTQQYFDTVWDYPWPYLEIAVEIECDNRPFTMDKTRLSGLW